MNIKQIAGVVVVVVGVLLVGYGIHMRSQMTRSQSEIHKMASSKNSIVKSMGKDLETKYGHNGRMKWCSIGGALLVVVGAGMVYCCRKKKRR